MEKFGKPLICYVDCGGTFTDGVLVDDRGNFILEKVSSVSEDVSKAFFGVLDRLADRIDVPSTELIQQLEVLGFGATLVVNALLTRSGRKCGMIITRGFEDLFEIGRGKSAWIHMESVVDHVHPACHYRLEPIIPRHLIKGVYEAVDRYGNVVAPVHEHEVRKAAKELVDKGVEAIIVFTLWDIMNPANERRAAEITREVVGDHIPVYEGFETCPIIREWPRACTTVIEAYTADILGKATQGISNRAREMGFKKDVLMMQSTGGVVTAERSIAVNTIQSGPVGGLIGGRFIGQLYGYDNIITTDIGGTSFDVGLIVHGNYRLNREPVVLNMVVNVPIAEIISIGAGGGSIAGVDPITKGLFVGPRSAGATPGPACYGKGGEFPTVTDADVVLGYIDPDYFLGGTMRVDKKKAIDSIRKYVAEPLGMDVIQAAWSIKALIDATMAQAVRSQLVGRGYDPREFVLLAFGGAGPTHVAGYIQGIPLKNVMIFLFSAGFSAFGATTADIERTRTKTVGLVVPPSITDERKIAIGKEINEVFEELEKWVIEQLETDGVSIEKAKIRRIASIRYGRQLHDILVECPVERINSPEDFDALIAAFEHDYVATYSMSAKFARAGYEIFDVAVSASYSQLKPKLPTYPLASREPDRAATKGKRNAYFGGAMVDVEVYDMDKLRPGNVLNGPCLIDSRTTTAVIPEDCWVEVDEYLTMKLKKR